VKILGCISGSSLDGLDLALCQFKSANSFELLKAETIPYTVSWQNRLRAATHISLKEACQLEYDYGRLVAQFITDFIGDESVDYVSSHGHTILHDPHQHYTFQLGNGAYLSGLLNLPVVSEFRIQDMAKGGQGAPIAPIVEHYLFPGHTYYLNLGGISNISIHSKENITAYDIGPANQLLNNLTKLKSLEFDEDGALARSGTLIEPLLQSALKHEYFSMPAPKSLDNSFVVEQFVQPFLSADSFTVEDRLNTAVEFIIKTITNELSIKDQSLLVTGGGALNTFLIERLSQECAKLNIDLVVPSKQVIEFKEGILMALMAYLRILKKSNVLSSVTGASNDTVAGAIFYGS